MVNNNDVVYGKSSLPQGIRSRIIPAINGLNMHILEAGFEQSSNPCVLLLHGFPELAYSWRKQLLPLARQGYHVIAPDLRGYGRTTGWDNDFDGDVGSFRLLNIVKDCLALVYAMGIKSVAAVIGHDFGSPVAAYCALIRPDVFQSLVLLSAPFAGAPSLAFNSANKPEVKSSKDTTDIHYELSQLVKPRKHYRWYYSQREANENMQKCRQGVGDFLRAYYHVKSADWTNNDPQPLKSWTADELAKLPNYYVMDLESGMAETVVKDMPSVKETERCHWLTDVELAVYAEEYSRNGFQGGLQWYRCGTNPEFMNDLQVFAGRSIDVPSCFIAGAKDWGIYQTPNAIETMKQKACTNMLGVHFVKGAGHWVQQEQADATNSLILSFLDNNDFIAGK